MFHDLRAQRDGFTVVELITVIVIIGLLSTLTFSLSRSYIYTGQDSERQGDSESIVRAFESSYNFSTTANGPTYPTTNQATDTSLYSTLFKGNDRDITRAPGITTGTSIVAASSTTQPQSPTKDQYIYQPFTATNTLCTTASGALCVRFTLYYRVKETNVVKSIESLHQQ